MYRELGIGVRKFFRKENGKDIFIYNVAELESYIKKYNGKKDMAISVFFFEEERGTPRERHESAIFDCIFFDIDADSFSGAKNDIINLHERWLVKHDIKASIFFTGNRGFHVMIYFNEYKSPYKKKILKRLQRNITEQTQMKFVDSHIFGDLARIMRVMNSIHTKTGLYCIPIKYSELLWLSEERIKKLAEKPRKLDHEITRKVIAKYNADKIGFLLKRTEEEIEKETLDFQRDIRAGKIKMPKFDVKACTGVREAMKGVGVGKRDDVLCGLINYFKLSKTPKPVAKKKLAEFIARCDGDKADLYSQLDYKIDYHYDSKYRPCSFLSRSGLCEKCDIQRQYE